MAIRIVLWDIGNVIIDSHHLVGINALVKFGLPYMRARTFFKHQSYRDFARGTTDAVGFWRQQTAQLGFGFSLMTMREAHDEHMVGVDLEVLEIVRAVKLPVAWATATNEWQTARQRQLVDLQSMYPNARWFCSNETGKLKTDPGAFEEIAARLGVAPNEILFVDDNVGNCAAASAVGLSTVQYKDAKQLAADLAYNKVL